MLTVELICDCCGRTRSMDVPYRASRPITDALAVGVEVFNGAGYRVLPDGRQVCRWCTLWARVSGTSGKIRENLGKFGTVIRPGLRCVGIAAVVILSLALKVILLEREEE